MLQFKVTDMTCAMCQQAVEKKLNSISGVTKASVNLANEIAYVEAKPQLIETLVDSVAQIGYGLILIDSEKTITFDVQHDISLDTLTALQQLNGIKKAIINDKNLIITFSPQLIKTIDITQWLQTQHVVATINQQELLALEKKQKQAKKREQKRLRVVLCAGLILLIFTMSPMLGVTYPAFVTSLLNVMIQMILVTIIVFFSRDIYQRGWRALINKVPNMDSLVTLGTGAAIIYSLYQVFLLLQGDDSRLHHLYFESAGVVLALIQLGKYFEKEAKGKTGAALTSLLALVPKKVTLVRKEELIEIDSDELTIGDIIAIKPGESIGGDGIIISGQSAINEAMLTGESIPVDKGVNDEVVQGTINGEGYLTVKITRSCQQTKLAQIIQLVEESQAKKAPIAKLVDKISLYFVPTVMLLALATFIGWLLYAHDLEAALLHMISVLVIACPCALGLATPTAIMVGSGVGARNQIYIKSSEIIEKGSTIDTVVFDKTGTLTKGEMTISAYDFLNHDATLILQGVASLEAQSQHPLALAIVNYAKAHHITLVKPADFKALHGLGIIGTIADKEILVGNYALFKQRNISSIDEEKVNDYLARGYTTLLVAINRQFVGLLGISDMVKEESESTIEHLHQLGIKTILVTGDNQIVAKNLAQKLKIQQVYAEVMPDEKAQIIEALQQEGHHVLMVGDGVNDAIALVKADIGLAVAKGVDVAIDAADIVLLKDDLRLIDKALRLTKATMVNIKQNLFWAFIYNIVALPLAMGLLAAWHLSLNPMLAGLAMAFSSLSVVLNALRLNYFK